jgi:phosphonoacetate hydrolase
MSLTVNERSYTLPQKPVVFVCMDGTAPEYLEAARAEMPNLERMRARGAAGVARSVIPSFTNPNNLSLVTGVPPAVHGISGNFYYDREGDREVMMNDPAFLRCPTVLAAAAEAGSSVAAVTTKDKLRRLLGKGLQGVCFSVERAHEATEEENGISGVVEKIGRSNPGVYDPECSVYCIEAGDWLLRDRRPDLIYLSTTDYVQHKHAPDEPEARAFYARVDHFLGRIDEQDVILGLTADHGMNAKTQADGSPRVQFLESILTEAGVHAPRVILPITDPYVVHHGALGSFATIYLENGQVARAAALLREVPGVELVLTREEAAARFELPADQLGELVALSDAGTVLGRTPEWHDLSSVSEGLRSHGGLHEQEVPIVINRPLTDEYARRLESGEARNYDILDFLCNGVRT